MSKKRTKQIPEQDVATFWDQHDAIEVMDLSAHKRVELIHTPPVQSISLRLPVPLLSQIKKIAAGMDIAYQALIKVWLMEKARDTSYQSKNSS